MLVPDIKREVKKLQQDGKSMFLTSSFQTQSVPLLHIISQTDNTIPIYYLNTGFLFPETLTFIQTLTDAFSINVMGIQSSVSKVLQRDINGTMLYASDPDYCCELNKIKPMEVLLQKYDYWISGVRADQNANRSTLNVYEESAHGASRFHPMLDWTAKNIYDYIREYQLPKHPLEKEGYISIGCEPCTRKHTVGEKGRDGRWFGMSKSECGLHTELVKKEK